MRNVFLAHFEPLNITQLSFEYHSLSECGFYHVHSIMATVYQSSKGYVSHATKKSSQFFWFCELDNEFCVHQCPLPQSADLNLIDAFVRFRLGDSQYEFAIDTSSEIM